MPSRHKIGTRKLLHLQQLACREPLCNLANELIHNSQSDYTTTFDPMSLPLLVPNRLPPDIPYAPTLPLAIPILPDYLGKGDIYTDDSIFVTPEINNNIEHVAKAVPLTFNAIARPLSPEEGKY